MNEPHDPSQPPAEGLNPGPSAPDECSRTERRRQLLRFGTAVPMVFTLRPGSTLAASDACTSDEDPENPSSVGCRASIEARQAAEFDDWKPTRGAGRAGSSYAKYWLDRS